MDQIQIELRIALTHLLFNMIVSVEGGNTHDKVVRNQNQSSCKVTGTVVKRRTRTSKVLRRTKNKPMFKRLVGRVLRVVRSVLSFDLTTPGGKTPRSGLGSSVHCETGANKVGRGKYFINI